MSSNAAPFGTVMAPVMATSVHRDGTYGATKLGPVEPLPIHPAAHGLHYGSVCFEGLKAHRGADGVVRMFRPDAHVERMRRSAQLLHLPPPPADLLHGMLRDVVAANRDEVPEAPGSLYLRPVLMGIDENIGAAASPSSSALLYVLASPVGDYFSGGVRPLGLLVETQTPRTTPQFGQVKSGANYVMALGPTLEARREHGVDQVLFAPGGQVQETGAANFLLLDDERVVTPALDSTFLHGVTRDSVLQLARDLGYAVEERVVTVDDLRGWRGEAALTGTAAVLSGVGRLVLDGEEHLLGAGEVGPNTLRLRDALIAVQRGEADDLHGWTEPV